MTKRILAALLALAMALSLCSFEVFAAETEVAYEFKPASALAVGGYTNITGLDWAKFAAAVEQNGATVEVEFDATLSYGWFSIQTTESGYPRYTVYSYSASDADNVGSCSVSGKVLTVDSENLAKLLAATNGKGYQVVMGVSGANLVSLTVKVPASSSATLPSGKVTLDGNDGYWAEYPISTTAALTDLNKALTEYAGKPGYMVVITSKESVSVGFNTTAPEGDWAQPDAATTIKFGTEAYSPSEIDKVCLNTNAKNVEISWEIIKEECKHENPSYVVNEDGTHSAICKNCCLYIKSEYKQAHTFKDGKCSFCGTPEVEDPDKVELGVQVYVQETVVAWAGAYKGLKTGKEVEFELTNEAALAEMADIVAKPEVTKNYTQAPVFALQVSIDNCDYNTKEVDGKYPTVNFAFHYGDITIKAKGFEDVVIPGDSVDVELTAKYESWGGYSGTSTTIDLYSAVMKLKDMTLEKFCKEYLPAITSITCDLEYDSLTCHHDVKTYKSNKDKATHTVTCAFCGEVIDAAEAHDGDPCSKCDYTAAEKDSKKKTNYPGYVVQLGEEYHGFFMGGFMITMPHTFVGDECTQCGYIRPAAVEEAPAESAE